MAENQSITLFLSPRFSPDSRIIQDAALKTGWKINRLHRWEIPAEIPSGKIVVYGETLFARFMEEHLPFRLLDPPHDWLTRLPQTILHRKIEMTSIGEARKIQSPCFIKPVDDKTFKAGIIQNGNELPSHLEAHEMALVSEIVKWEVEYRFFLLNGKALTGSVYSRFGELNEDSGNATDFETAKKLAEEFAGNLPAGVVVDTGKISGKGWSVVEANPAWGSGIYNCDASLALGSIAASCG